MQRLRIGFISSCLSVIILLTAAFTNAAPLSAIAMNEGRTYDQAHDTGYIDWSGSAQYVVVTHRDGSSLPPEEGGASCGSSCSEWVTRLGNGGTASGAFDRDVSYFEVMVEFSRDSNVGSATLRACSAFSTWYLYNSGGSLPGYVSMVLKVPAGCRSWSISASGGYVDFRSVDVNYSGPPSTSTLTATLVPSATYTLTATLVPSATSTMTWTPTSTATSTETPTSTFTATFTASPTATESFTPTQTNTWTATHTANPTSTRTKTPVPNTSALLRPTYTPTLAWVATVTLTPTPTNTTAPPSPATSTATPTFAASTRTGQSTLPETRRPVLPIWQVAGLIGLFFVIASASVIDPRPAALDRIRERLDHFFLHSSDDES